MIAAPAIEAPVRTVPEIEIKEDFSEEEEFIWEDVFKHPLFPEYDDESQFVKASPDAGGETGSSGQ